MANIERRIIGEPAPLNPAQIAAIKLSNRDAKQLADRVPKIADDYRAGATVGQLAEKHGALIEELFPRMTEAIKATIVRRAVNRMIDPYQRGVLGEQHMRDAGRRARDQGTGFFGMSAEDKRAARSKGIETQRARGVGLFGLSAEKKRQIGINRAISQGKTPFSDAEIQAVLDLWRDPAFAYTSGCNRGKPNVGLIARTITKDLVLPEQQQH